MNVITHNAVTIEDLTKPIHWYELEIPAGKVRQAIINGEKDATIKRLAKEATIYRTEDRTNLVVTDAVHRNDQVLATTTKGSVVLRKERMTCRPLFDKKFGVLARFETRVHPSAMTTLLVKAKELGFEPAISRESRIGFVRTGRAAEYLKHLNANDYHFDAHLIVRGAVIAMRSGGDETELTLRGNAFDADDNDGTVVIHSGLERPYQGTLKTADGSYVKGIARPPITFNNETEQEGWCRDAAFGRKIEKETDASFFVLSHLPESQARLNKQTIEFTAIDPAEVFKKDNARLASLDVMDLMNDEQRRKIKAGVPIGMMMNELGPWNWVTNIPVDGIRDTVYASDLIPVGGIAFLPDTFRKLKAELGESITLNRDPALPNSSAMSDYTVVGCCYWGDSIEGHGIVINPLDPEWGAAGGDFDGDAAVAFRRDFARRERIEPATDLKSRTLTPLKGFGGKPSIAATILGLANGMSTRLGSVITAATRLAEHDLLTDEWRQFTSDLAQGCVSAQKHSMRTRDGLKMYEDLMLYCNIALAEKTTVSDALRGVKNAKGYLGKGKAWRELTGPFLQCLDVETELQQALVERIQILDELFRANGVLRGARTVLPDSMRQTAMAWTLEFDDAGEQAEFVTSRTETYRRLVREMTDADQDDDSLIDALRAEVGEIRSQIQAAVWTGKLHPCFLIAYGTHRMAAEMASAEDFEALNERVTEIVTIIAEPIEDGEYKAGDIHPHNDEENAVPLTNLDPSTPVEVKVLTIRKSGYHQIHVSW